jgi:hypothetical protein
MYDLHPTCLYVNLRKDWSSFELDENRRVVTEQCPGFKGVYEQKLETLHAALVPLLAEHLSERAEKQIYTLILWTKNEQTRLHQGK